MQNIRLPPSLGLALTLLLSTVDAAELPPARTQKLPALPDPLVVFTGMENYQAGGQNMVRYKLAVKNYDAYPAAMFAPAPNLPPCGANPNSSRTWVEIYTGNPKLHKVQRLYGFCVVTPQLLTQLWFAKPQGQQPPSPVYVILNDRQANKKYVSNPVNIPPPAPTTPGSSRLGKQ